MLNNTCFLLPFWPSEEDIVHSLQGTVRTGTFYSFNSLNSLLKKAVITDGPLCPSGLLSLRTPSQHTSYPKLKTEGLAGTFDISGDTSILLVKRTAPGGYTQALHSKSLSQLSSSVKERGKSLLHARLLEF